MGESLARAGVADLRGRNAAPPCAPGKSSANQRWLTLRTTPRLGAYRGSQPSQVSARVLSLSSAWRGMLVLPKVGIALFVGICPVSVTPKREVYPECSEEVFEFDPCQRRPPS